MAVFTLKDEQIVWTDKSSDGLVDLCEFNTAANSSNFEANFEQNIALFASSVPQDGQIDHLFVSVRLSVNVSRTLIDLFDIRRFVPSETICSSSSMKTAKVFNVDPNFFQQ